MARVNRRWVLLLIGETVEISNVEACLKLVDVWVRTSPRGDKLALEVQYATLGDLRFILRTMKKVADWPATVAEGVALVKTRIKEEAQNETQEEVRRTESDWTIVGNAIVRKDSPEAQAQHRRNEDAKAQRLKAKQEQHAQERAAEAQAETQGIHSGGY